MGSQVYIGNLPTSATETALSNLVSEHGKVERVTMITDHRTGLPLGYAFAEMATKRDAERVIEALDGTSYGGWVLTFRAATPNRV